MKEIRKYVLKRSSIYVTVFTLSLLSTSCGKKEGAIISASRNNNIATSHIDLLDDEFSEEDKEKEEFALKKSEERYADYKKRREEAIEQKIKQELYEMCSTLIHEESMMFQYIEENHEQYIDFYIQNRSMSPKDVILNVNIKNCEVLPYYNNEYKDRYVTYHKNNPEIPIDKIIVYVNIGLDTPFYSNTKDIENPYSDLIIANKYNKLPADFVPNGYDKNIDRDLSIKGVASEAFKEMKQAAKEEGLYISSVSAYRSYNYQESVYWRQSKLDEFFSSSKRRKNLSEEQIKEYRAWRDNISAREGHSEHQTGLAVDINSTSESFAKTPEGKWLADNSYKYGYILRYPKGKEHITGYDYEPWHFRYIGVKMATAVYESGLTYDEFHAMFIEPILRKDPKTSELSSDDFYNLHVEKVFNQYASPQTEEELIMTSKTR